MSLDIQYRLREIPNRRGTATLEIPQQFKRCKWCNKALPGVKYPFFICLDCRRDSVQQAVKERTKVA